MNVKIDVGDGWSTKYYQFNSNIMKMEILRKDLGLQLTELRTQRHMSQEELALKSGLCQSVICDIERGRRNPGIKILHQLAEGLGSQLLIYFSK